MSYFKNPYFLTQNASVISKTEYLQMLSMRRISEAQNYIAKNYIRKDLDNPFINIKGNKIHFYLEQKYEETNNIWR